MMKLVKAFQLVAVVFATLLVLGYFRSNSALAATQETCENRYALETCECFIDEYSQRLGFLQRTMNHTNVIKEVFGGSDEELRSIASSAMNMCERG